MQSAPRRLADCHNVLDLREVARHRLPAPIFGYLDGGAETETTLRRNTEAFARDGIIARCLVDVATVSTATRVLGQEIAWPLICSPTGASRFYHPDGELAVARAAAASGVLYGLSTMSTYPLEQVAAASAGPKMFQLYVFKDRGFTHELIRCAKAAGFQALCITVDAAIRGKRERELRTGLGIPLGLNPRSLASFAMRPGWFLVNSRKGPLSMANLVARCGAGMAARARFIRDQLDPSVTWSDVQALAGLWGGPFALKGIMAADDARRAVEAGASAVFVSNHGGRQLDGAVAAYEALPEIAEAVGDRADVILDGGVRRGSHILKALARGARACSVGRPYLYGLAAGGEAGVARALELLREELVGAMQLAGCSDVRAIDPALVRKVPF